jgi:hypothetical protein
MATLKQAFIFSKWVTDATGTRLSQLEAAFQARAIDAIGGWSDMTEQLDSEIADLPVCIIEGVITAAQLTAVQGDSRFLVIASRDIDSVTKNTTGGNFGSTLTQVQVNAFKSWLTTNWPNLPVTTVNRCDTLVGQTRIQAARAVVGFIRRKADAGVQSLQAK